MFIPFTIIHSYPYILSPPPSPLVHNSPNLLLDPHSQTFENKSSPPDENPPAGFPAPEPAFAAGVTGAALLQPPKSSSAATFGALAVVLKLPPVPGTILWVDKPPQLPKSPALV